MSPARRLRLARALRAEPGGVRVGSSRLRPPRARGGGRDQCPPATQARGLRRFVVRGPQDRALLRRRRDGRVRRDPGVHRRRFRRRRPSRPGQRAHRDPSPRRRPARPARARAGGGAPRGGRPRRRRLPARDQWSRHRHPPGRVSGVLRDRRGQPGRAHLQAQAGSPRDAPGDRATARPTRSARHGRLAVGRARYAPVLSRRARPPPARQERGRHVQRSAHQRARRQPHAGDRPPERGHAEDLRVGRDRCRPDRDRRHLRNELRGDAGAPTGLGLSGRARRDRHRLSPALPRFRRSGWL